MPSYVMLVGVPGSGKTTYANSINRDSNNLYTIISRDDILTQEYPNMTYSEAFNIADHKYIDSILEGRHKEALSSGRDVIVDMTNLTKKSRAKKLALVPEGYIKYAVCVDATYDTLMERAADRLKEGKGIPKSVIKRMLDSFEMPTKEEGFDVVGVLNG